MTNPPPISDYERLRLERIDRNNARLASLGLLDAAKKIKPAATPKKKRSASAALVTPSPTRASRRVKRRVDIYQPSFEDHPTGPAKISEFVGARVSKHFDGELFLGTVTVHDVEYDWFSIVYDDLDKEEFTREELMEALLLYQREGMKMDKNVSVSAKCTNASKVKPKVRCEIPIGTFSSPLSEKQKSIIDLRMENNFIEKFEDYLTYVDVISESNRRNVLKQITKLVDGEGIRYESKAYGWPEGCYFMKGVKINPHDDILKLMDLGQQCEDEWGRDHGNGWLLSHPLKKLYQFQQYCLKEKIVSF